VVSPPGFEPGTL